MCLVSRQRLSDRFNYTVIVIALVVTAIDALSKIWARHALDHHAVHVGGAIWLRLQYNSGISFSFNQIPDRAHHGRDASSSPWWSWPSACGLAAVWRRSASDC